MLDANVCMLSVDTDNGSQIIYIKWLPPKKSLSNQFHFGEIFLLLRHCALYHVYINPQRNTWYSSGLGPT